MRKNFPLVFQVSLYYGLAVVLLCALYLLFVTEQIGTKYLIQQNLLVIILSGLLFIHMGLFWDSGCRKFLFWFLFFLGDTTVAFILFNCNKFSFTKEGFLLLTAFIFYGLALCVPRAKVYHSTEACNYE